MVYVILPLSLLSLSTPKYGWDSTSSRNLPLEVKFFDSWFPLKKDAHSITFHGVRKFHLPHGLPFLKTV